MANQMEEYSVKAAFLFNFLKFISWPSESLSDATGLFQLCIKGNKETVAQFNVLNDKKIRSRALKVNQMSSAGNPQTCDIIFITQNTPLPVLKKILSKVQGKPVLTIGETKGFLKHGGVINFYPKNDRFHFEINPGAAKYQGITISALLLQIALIVDYELVKPKIE